MSKFNRTPVDTSKTINLAGGEAFNLDSLTALYATTATSLGGGAGDKYYLSATQEYQNILGLINKVAKENPAFIFQLAAYVRNEMKLRSIPMILFIEGIRAMHALKKSSKDAYPVNAAEWGNQIFGRPDEITEAIAYWKHITNDSNKLPQPVRKALAEALNKFNEYSMIKYDSDKKEVKFRDVIRRVHPVPKSEAQSALFKYLITDEIDAKLMPLTTARKKLIAHGNKFDTKAKKLIVDSNATWETVISQFGASKEVWEAVLPNMGFMAVLRNLNNFIKNNVDVTPVISMLTNSEEVAKSKQLPFRFLSAFKALSQDETESRYSFSPSMLDAWQVNGSTKKDELKKALATALQLSVVNIPKLEGRTLSCADVSGSMDKHLNEKSTISLKEIACLFTAMAEDISANGIASSFGTSFTTIKRTKNVLETAQAIADTVHQVGMSTNAWTILDYLVKNKILVKRVIYFTDTQCYNSYGRGTTLNNLWQQYRTWAKSQGVDAHLFEVNLVGGNTSSFNANNGGVHQIAGWSERIFDLINLYEEDPSKAVKKIQKLYPASLAQV